MLINNIFFRYKFTYIYPKIYFKEINNLNELFFKNLFLLILFHNYVLIHFL